MPSYLQRWKNIFFVPALHYNLETACYTLQAAYSLKPSCLAVEAPRELQGELMHAASRLPDISVVEQKAADSSSLYYLVEPADATSEALRCGLELGIPTFCLDLLQTHYPGYFDPLPDPYAIHGIGLASYYQKASSLFQSNLRQDQERESFIAFHLSELSKYYETVLYVGGMSHIQPIIERLKAASFSPPKSPLEEVQAHLFTVEEASYRSIQGEVGYLSTTYEQLRTEFILQLEQNSLLKNEADIELPPSRLDLYLHLLQKAKQQYEKATGVTVQAYHMRNLLRFYRKYASIQKRLLPSCYELLAGARACVDHNFAYELWLAATDYPHLKNLDNLEKRHLSVEDVWGGRKILHFHLKQKSQRAFQFQKRARDSNHQIQAQFNPYSICSYQPEDKIIEAFASHLKKRGQLVQKEANSRTVPFSSSLEDGIDIRETMRNITDKKIYVRTQGKPPYPSGSVVVIFNEGNTEGRRDSYPWCTTWLGEHDQESDMAFYATPMQGNLIGPGIARCSYGGIMMTYPPGRLHNIWEDSFYEAAKSKAERLLLAAIDYSQEPVVIYVAKKPPSLLCKQVAQRFSKKIIYIPIGQLSPIQLQKMQTFHVLAGHHVRSIADDYIY